VTEGHDFYLIGLGSMPPGEHFNCKFCGGPGRHFVLLRRDDGIEVKVGRDCLKRVGLELPETIRNIKFHDRKSTPRVKTDEEMNKGKDTKGILIILF